MRAMYWHKINWIRINQEKERSVPKNWIPGFKCPCLAKVSHSSYSNFIFYRGAFLLPYFWHGTCSCQTLGSQLRNLLTGSL